MSDHNINLFGQIAPNLIPIFRQHIEPLYIGRLDIRWAEKFDALKLNEIVL